MVSNSAPGEYSRSWSAILWIAFVEIAVEVVFSINCFVVVASISVIVFYQLRKYSLWISGGGVYSVRFKERVLHRLRIDLFISSFFPVLGNKKALYPQKECLRCVAYRNVCLPELYPLRFAQRSPLERPHHLAAVGHSSLAAGHHSGHHHTQRASPLRALYKYHSLHRPPMTMVTDTYLRRLGQK